MEDGDPQVEAYRACTRLIAHRWCGRCLGGYRAAHQNGEIFSFSASSIGKLMKQVYHFDRDV